MTRFFIAIFVLFAAGYVTAQSLDIPRYNRAEWRHWIDRDRDCQNTRQELLINQSLISVTFTNFRNCTVKTGRWIGPYTGNIYTLASDIDVDHVIPLAYAHSAGGHMWSAEMKMEFANDPANLLLVDDAVNQAKSASGPSEFMPIESFHCAYINIWNEVANKYDLKLKEEDIIIIEIIKVGCMGN